MTGQTWAAVGVLLIALVLPLAALRGSRIPAGRAARLAAIWLAIFVAVAVVFSIWRP